MPDIPDDYVPLIVVSISIFGAGVVAWLGRLTWRIHKFEQREQLWWLWTRELINHIYLRKPPPHPPAPIGLFESKDK